jgi:acetyltransferase-like isoleucine patch superfamily enzyme
MFKDKNKLIKEQGYTTAGVLVGKNCWIGSNTIILKGVSIGDNVVIGANNLIIKDIPSNTVVKSSVAIGLENAHPTKEVNKQRTFQRTLEPLRRKNRSDKNSFID